MTNQLKTAVMLAALSGLLIAISYWVIGGSSGLIIGIGSSHKPVLLVSIR